LHHTEKYGIERSAQQRVDECDGDYSLIDPEPECFRSIVLWVRNDPAVSVSIRRQLGSIDKTIKLTIKLEITEIGLHCAHMPTQDEISKSVTARWLN